MRSGTAFRVVLGASLLMSGASLALAGEKGHSEHKATNGGKTVAATAAKEKDMVVIPRGEFTMGSKEHADEPAHNVVTDAYAIDKYEVSNDKYKQFMTATGHPAPAYWDDPRLGGRQGGGGQGARQVGQGRAAPAFESVPRAQGQKNSHHEAHAE